MQVRKINKNMYWKCGNQILPFFSDLGNEQSLVLLVVLTLTDCPVTCNALLTEEQNIVLELCTSCLVLEHHAAASQALGILTKLVAYCYIEKITPPIVYMEQINLHIESLIYTSLINEKLGKELKQYLKCGVSLSTYNKDFGETFVEIIAGLLTDNFGNFISFTFLFYHLSVFLLGHIFSLSIETFDFTV